MGGTDFMNENVAHSIELKIVVKNGGSASLPGLSMYVYKMLGN